MPQNFAGNTAMNPFLGIKMLIASFVSVDASPIIFHTAELTQ